VQNESVIDLAMGILMARHGCTHGEADALLRDAARGQNLDVSDLAMCLVADQELR
jgi:AmiR/NasT family two-component response regulator